jgi:hypothetical protein
MKDDSGGSFGELYMKLANSRPIDDFQGLSADQMHHFLYSPFTSPQVVSFPESLRTEPSAPILSLFSMLAEAIGKKGLKPTAKGNLPRKVVREVGLAFLGQDGYRDRTLFGGMNKEKDFPELEATRIVAQLAGLIRKYKGRFILGRECRKLMAGSGFKAIYPKLFRTYLETFNWDFRDAFREAPLIQQTALFSLYLLARYGDSPRSQVFYEDCFVRAFPQAVAQIIPTPYSRNPEEELRAAYTRRILNYCFEFFGLAKAKLLNTQRTYGRDYRVVKTALLDEAIRFHLWPAE